VIENKVVCKKDPLPVGRLHPRIELSFTTPQTENSSRRVAATEGLTLLYTVQEEEDPQTHEMKLVFPPSMQQIADLCYQSSLSEELRQEEIINELFDCLEDKKIWDLHLPRLSGKALIILVKDLEKLLQIDTFGIDTTKDMPLLITTALIFRAQLIFKRSKMEEVNDQYKMLLYDDSFVAGGKVIQMEAALFQLIKQHGFKINTSNVHVVKLCRCCFPFCGCPTYYDFIIPFGLIRTDVIDNLNSDLIPPAKRLAFMIMKALGPSTRIGELSFLHAKHRYIAGQKKRKAADRHLAVVSPCIIESLCRVAVNNGREVTYEQMVSNCNSLFQSPVIRAEPLPDGEPLLDANFFYCRFPLILSAANLQKIRFRKYIN